MRVIGIDIGTTTLCAVVLDCQTGAVLESVTEKNDAALPPCSMYERAQDPGRIIHAVRRIADTLCRRHAPVASIGLSGQMHGILYVDASGNALSKLFTWQDGRGDEPFANGQTYARALSGLTGHALATGFGLVTHFYNVKNNLVPRNANALCTIHDYAAMALCQQSRPLMHASNAASLGLFDLDECGFDTSALARAGLDASLLPPVTTELSIIGKTADGVPVAVAIGDNQASYLGSVAHDDDSLLINIGTGSQISFFAPDAKSLGALEARPLFGNGRLLVGSSLCGGSAYALLEKCLREAAALAGAQPENLYGAMNALADDFDKLSNPLHIATQFCGTRTDPQLRGSITNLGADNFTPAHLVCGVLAGIVQELYAMYEKSGAPSKHVLIGSGNGIRMNTALQRMLSQAFGVPLVIPRHKEEAAYGAALCGAVASGIFDSLDAARAIIGYL